MRIAQRITSLPYESTVYDTVVCVRDDLIVREGSTLFVPHLTYVDGLLTILTNAKLHAPNLIRVHHLSIRDAAFDAPNLTKINDSLTIYGNSTINAPVLTKVYGSLIIYDNSVLNAPELNDVGGRLLIYDRGILRGRAGAIAQPREDFSSFRRRYLAKEAITPHGRCARLGYCIEHASNRHIKKCSVAPLPLMLEGHSLCDPFDHCLKQAVDPAAPSCKGRRQRGRVTP